AAGQRIRATRTGPGCPRARALRPHQSRTALMDSRSALGSTPDVPVPSGPQELNPPWLTSVLRASGVLPSHGRVTAVRSQLVGQDRGLTGVLARLRLQYAWGTSTGSGAGKRAARGGRRAWAGADPRATRAPSTLIAKFTTDAPLPASLSVEREQPQSAAPPSPQRRNAFARGVSELLFYQQIAPGGLVPVPRL